MSCHKWHYLCHLPKCVLYFVLICAILKNLTTIHSLYCTIIRKPSFLLAPKLFIFSLMSQSRKEKQNKIYCWFPPYIPQRLKECIFFKLKSYTIIKFSEKMSFPVSTNLNWIHNAYIILTWAFIPKGFIIQTLVALFQMEKNGKSDYTRNKTEAANDQLSSCVSELTHSNT